MTVLHIKGKENKEEKKAKRKTWDEQIFSQFKIQDLGEIEEPMEWTERFDADENLAIPQEFMGPDGVNMKKLLKKYPLLGQEYKVLTMTEAEVMLKQIKQEGYIPHVYRLEASAKVKQIQIYAHVDFLKEKPEE